MILPSICLLSLYTRKNHSPITIEVRRERYLIIYTLVIIYCKIDNNVKTVMTEPKLEI